MARVQLVLVLGLAACADETLVAGAPMGWGPASATLYSPPAESGGIVGDWLYCQDARCSATSSSGLSFGADGTVSEVWVTDSTGAEIVYCLSDTRETYTWDGVTLAIHDAEGLTIACSVAFAGDFATVDCSLEQWNLVRLHGRQDGTCPVPMGQD